jgi:hypothetical protein
VHALQDSRTVFILMASFSAPPRKLPADLASPSGPGVWDPDSEQPAVDQAYDDKKDEPGITETLKFDKFAAKFDPPSNGTSIKPELQTQRRRPFQPAYQKSMPADIVPFKDATTEEMIWERFLERAKSKGVPLGSKVRAVQNYIKVRGGGRGGCGMALRTGVRLLDRPFRHGGECPWERGQSRRCP